MSIDGASIQTYAEGLTFVREPGFKLWTLELILSGRQLYRFGDFRYRLAPRTILLTPPDTAYRLRASGAGEELWVFLLPAADWLPLLDWPALPFGSRELGIPNNEAGDRVITALTETCRLWETPGPWRSRLAENAFERALLYAAMACPEVSGSRDERITQAVGMMHQNLADPLRVEDLARAAGLSGSRFAHLFRVELGMSPRRYLEHLRLEQAQDLLLNTRLTVGEVAKAVGIPDPCHFSTRFRRHTGQSPSSVRRLGLLPRK